MLLPCLLLGGSNAGWGAPSQLTLEHNKEVVRTCHEEVWSKGNVDLIPELYTEDFVCHFAVGPEWRGLNDVQAQVESIRTGFPDWRENIQRLVAEGDYVVSYFKSSGTHLGAFEGTAPTGNHVKIDEFALFRMKDGKIAEQWGLPDIHRMNIQLGVVEADDSAN